MNNELHLVGKSGRVIDDALDATQYLNPSPLFGQH